eukprot:scaffold429_cov114-Cylindrotheca_fusiformis.AAC.1
MKLSVLNPVLHVDVTLLSKGETDEIVRLEPILHVDVTSLSRKNKDPKNAESADNSRVLHEAIEQDG